MNAALQHRTTISTLGGTHNSNLVFLAANNSYVGLNVKGNTSHLPCPFPKRANIKDRRTVNIHTRLDYKHKLCGTEVWAVQQSRGDTERDRESTHRKYIFMYWC